MCIIPHGSARVNKVRTEPDCLTLRQVSFPCFRCVPWFHVGFPLVMVPEREKTVRNAEETAKRVQSKCRGFALPTLSDNSVTDLGSRAEFVDTERSREVMQRPGKDVRD